MLQYNLKTLMIVALAVCLMTWVLFVLPGTIGVLVIGFFIMTIPGMVVTGIIYLQGYGKAFCIGCAPIQIMLPVLFMIVMDELNWGRQMRDAFEMKIALLLCILLVVACGLGGVLMRYLAERVQQASPKPHPGALEGQSDRAAS